MKSFGKLLALPVAILALSAAPLAAQENPVELQGNVMVEKTVTDEAGESRTEYVAPEKVVPGDRLLFSTEFRNVSGETVENFVVTNPLPSAVRLSADADPDLMVSVDGGANWGTLEELTVTNEDGTSRKAEHGDVTHIRWTLPSVGPGESGRVEYPAIIR